MSIYIYMEAGNSLDADAVVPLGLDHGQELRFRIVDHHRQVPAQHPCRHFTFFQ